MHLEAPSACGAQEHDAQGSLRPVQRDGVEGLGSRDPFRLGDERGILEPGVAVLTAPSIRDPPVGIADLLREQAHIAAARTRRPGERMLMFKIQPGLTGGHGDLPDAIVASRSI